MASIYSNNETININPTDDLVLYKEEFIDSRIEKFLYAICALDFDNLPTPLSRIEELYKCLATGLPAPTFVPQSRVEKYLMAILGDYDASALPAPQSRTEVLLNKILIGDTDLSDIKWLKSRYEFLLAYIAKGGKISSGSGDDFEYLQYIFSSSMYSIDRTKETPVKSAILSGNTLVNVLDFENRSVDNNTPPIKNGDTISFTSDNRDYRMILFWLDYKNPLIKPNTKYIIMYDSIVGELLSTNSIRVFSFKDGVTNTLSEGYNPNKKYQIFTTPDYIINLEISLRIHATLDDAMVNTIIIKGLKVLEYQDGMENWDIPYFEGIQSVKMPVLMTTGKNLFDKTNIIVNKVIDNYGSLNNFNGRFTSDYIKVNSDEWYTGISPFYTMVEYDKDKNFIGINTDNSITRQTSSNCHYIRICLEISELDNIQIERGTQPSSYEPYKSNILSASEDVTLRGIGKVRDELDLLTGEVVQNIGEIVLDGSESWGEYASQELTNTRLFYCGVPTNSNINTSKSTMINNRFASLSPDGGGLWNTDVVGLGHGVVKNAFRLRILKSTANTISELKEYLHSNPIVVQYELAEKSIKTVDLSVVDQDGNNTKLSSFEDITHVAVTSEGILPDVELEVAKYYPYLTFLLESVSMDTLYNTKEVPVKNAILNGRTLVNLAKNKKQVTVTGGSTTWKHVTDLSCTLTPNKKYLFKVDIITNTIDIGADGVCLLLRQIGTGGSTCYGPSFSQFENGCIAMTIDEKYPNIDTVSIYAVSSAKSGTFTIDNIRVIEYQEGMKNWDIPYFEGIQSVKMPVLMTTGKNLFDKTNIIVNKVIDNYGSLNNFNGRFTSDYIKVNSDEWYTGISPFYTMVEYDKDKNFIGINTDNSITRQTSSNCHYIRICLEISELDNIQIEQGSVNTSYEPYKSATVTCNEEVELRGIGDVKDELDLVTGEVINKFGEVVLNGDENWSLYGSNPNQVNTVAFKLSHISHASSWGTGLGYCDKISFTNGDVMYGQDLECVTSDANNLLVRVSISKASSVDEFKAWLSNNNMRVIYPLKEEVVKTVDISTVNQDGNNTKLSSFEDITHVAVTSEGILPDVELEVANQFEEDLTTLSLRMNNIATTQEGLEESVNEQTQEVDSTMMATTEIYEGLL